MVSEPVKLRRCAVPPNTLASTQVEPRKPKGRRGRRARMERRENMSWKEEKAGRKTNRNHEDVNPKGLCQHHRQLC
jgi:hypothetical protein